MKFRVIFSILMFLSGGITFAQNVTIKGVAATHKSKEISVYLYDDLLTYAQTRMDYDTVDNKGVFELQLTVTAPQLAIIKVGQLAGRIYLQPNFNYGIIIPPVDTSRFVAAGTEQVMEIIINGDSTELNARIIDFNNRFDEFWQKHYTAFVSKHIHRELDSFQVQIFKRYEKVKLSYFKTYLEYTFALMNENTGRHRNYLAKKYLLDRPIAYGNYEYMEFFNQYFKQYLERQTISKNGTFILDAINEQGDYKHLNELMKNDPVLKNDTLRELVLIKGLYEMYYQPKNKKANIKQMLEQVNGSSSIAQHKKILFNILRVMNNMQVGSMAPAFSLLNAKRETISLSDYTNRFVYLSFFSTKSVECLEQFKKQEGLFSKYGDKVYFVSVCTDEDSTAFKNFVKQNARYKWVFLQGDKQTVQLYNAATTPVYFLIGMAGQLLQSPALKPDEGIERKFNEILKIKPKKPR
ncbi:MAG: TlpA family protein disulfide reductase [Bacteroidia bacterium]